MNYVTSINANYVAALAGITNFFTENHTFYEKNLGR